MTNWSLSRLVALAVTGLAAACGSSSNGVTIRQPVLLPANFIVSLSVVSQLFPVITRQSSAGLDASAVGNPIATRAVIFTNDDGSVKVTISVDQYGTTGEAASAYNLAVQKSSEIAGFTPVAIPAVGQKAFAGTVTMEGETHLGLGALDGLLVMGATLAGSRATPDNVTALVTVARAEDAGSQVALGCHREMSSGSLLPGNFILPLNAVSQLFPQAIRPARSGPNEVAVGNPIATREVIYADQDASMLVTISVDQYGSTNDAASAYQLALHKSSEVPGFIPIAIPVVGQKAFAGTVTMGGETHVGLGALDSTLIVGATLAGFSATTDNVTALVALARVEDAAADVAVECLNGQP